MRVRAADRAGIRFHRSKIQSAARKDSAVGIVHFIIAFVHACRVLVKRIIVLHDEDAGTHHAVTRTRLVSVFVCNLIEHPRQLSVRGNISLYEICKNLLRRRTEAEFTRVSVLKPPHFRSVSVPAAGFLPKLRRLHALSINFLRALCIHLFSDDLLDLADGSPTHRHVRINAGSGFFNHARAQQQNMAWDLGFRRNLSQCSKMHL